MGLAVACEGCQRLYKVSESMAGKTVRCKRCGTVFQVPLPVAAPPDARDPLDALAELEQTGRVMDQPVALSAPPALAVPAPSPRRPAVTPAPSWPTPSRQPARPSRSSDGRISIPLEDLIDAILPLATILLFLGCVAIDTIRLTLALSGVGKPVWMIWAIAGGLLFLCFAIAAPLGVLGVFVAGRIMKFPLPPGVYKRMCAVVCVPFALNQLVGLLSDSSDMRLMAMLLTLPLTIAVMWLLLRLRPLNFLLALVFVAVFSILGVVAVVMIVGLIGGMIAVMSGGGRGSGTARPFSSPGSGPTASPRPPVNRTVPVSLEIRAPAAPSHLRRTIDALPSYMSSRLALRDAKVQDGAPTRVVASIEVIGSDTVLLTPRPGRASGRALVQRVQSRMVITNSAGKVLWENSRTARGRGGVASDIDAYNDQLWGQAISDLRDMLPPRSLADLQ